MAAQLQAGNPEDRVCGLQSLANLTRSGGVRQLVLEGRLVRIAGPLLLDEDEMVRQAAAGALRCVASSGIAFSSLRNTDSGIQHLLLDATCSVSLIRALLSH
jgi:hypothetical protein